MPKRGKRHGPSHAIVDVVVVAAERLYPGFHTTGLDTLRPMGDGHGVVLGRAYPHSALDRAGAGVALAYPGARCRVWLLGPEVRRAGHAAVDRAGAACSVGTVPSGGPR